MTEVEQFLREIARVPLDKEKEERRLILEEQLSRYRIIPRVHRKSSSAPMSNRPTFVRDTVDINGCLVPLIRARRASCPSTKLGFSPLPRVKEEEEEEQLKKNIHDKTKPKQDLKNFKIPKIYVMHTTDLNNQVDFNKFIENGARVPVASGRRPRANTFPRANNEAETNTNELTAQYTCPRRKPDSSYIRLVSSLGLNGDCSAGSTEAHASPKKTARDIALCMVCN